MGNGKRQNALLVEIIIAVLFFGLTATVILDVFATAYLQTTYAAACNAAMMDGQNIAARIYVSDAPDALLEAEGFIAEGDVWQRNGEGYVLEVKLGVKAGETGELRTAQITAMRDEKAILEIPCAHYIPREVAQ